MDMKHKCCTFAFSITLNNTNMKKLLLFTMLVAVASMFTACENPDNKTAQNMKGTWEGSTYFGDDEYPADYQFFPDAESNTGKFLEIDYLSLTDEAGEDTYDMPYIAYVGGTYTVKDGKLFLNYDTESAWVLFDEDPVTDYVNAYLAYDLEYGGGEWQEYDPQDIIDYYIDTRTDELGSSWEEIITNFNSGMSNGYGQLKVTETQLSYHTSDLGELVFTKAAEDLFDEYPF